MKIAAKKAIKQNDWKGAMKIWKNEINNANKKITGKACFNLAVASEREGKLDEALVWANQAKQAGNKHAEKYISILNKRMKSK